MSYQGTRNLHQERHGRGHYTYQNKFFKYHGNYHHNVKNSDMAVLELGDGSSIEAPFRNGEIEGKGIRRYPNGAYYEGRFHMGERFGNGTFYGADNVEKLQGNWRYNRLFGQAELCQLKNQDRILHGFYEEHYLHSPVLEKEEEASVKKQSKQDAGDSLDAAAASAEDSQHDPYKIHYIFMNGKATYLGGFFRGKFHFSGRFEAERFYNESTSSHMPLPAGTSLPQNSILKRYLRGQDVQPVWECYEGQWKHGKKHGYGKWSLRLTTKKEVQQEQNNNTQDEEVHLLHFDGYWTEDCPTFAPTHLFVVNPSQNNWRSISNPFIHESNEHQDDTTELDNVLVMDEPTQISIPQITAKMSTPLELCVLLTRKRKQPPPPKTEESTTEEDFRPASSKKKDKASKKGKKTETTTETTEPPEDQWEFVQLSSETGRIIECSLFKIPDAFVKKKPAKGEEPEVIRFDRLPSQHEACEAYEGIPQRITIGRGEDESEFNVHANVTLDFSQVPVGYYAIRFRNKTMTLGIKGSIQDHIVYVQVVKK